MAFYEKGPARIHYQEAGSGFPLFVIPGEGLTPKSELTFFPWKDTKEKIPLAVRHVRTFLKANRPA